MSTIYTGLSPKTKCSNKRKDTGDQSMGLKPSRNLKCYPQPRRTKGERTPSSFSSSLSARGPQAG